MTIVSAGPPVPASVLTPRGDRAAAERLARSAAARDGSWLRTEDFAEWLEGRRRAHHFGVERIPFAELDGWSFDGSTGNLVHRSGRFFSVEGVRVTRDSGPHREWSQPIIRQPEVGILGLLVKEFDGVLHFLMQAKMEPGNANLLQLSPTVQATRSNYTKVHRGADVKYIEYFTEPGRRRVIADSLQSEHGAWFFHKSNRNMIVEALDEVPDDPDFIWLTLGQIGELLRRDNVVNMDTRTVLACAPLPQREESALHSDTDVVSWFTAERARHGVRAERLPLAEVRGWQGDTMSLAHEEDRYFRVMAVRVEAGNREVTGWTQPMFEPCGLGVAAFVTRTFDGVPHVLMEARVEAGLLDTLELAPTVMHTPGNYAGRADGYRPPFLDMVLDLDPSRIRYEAVHSEEGGRFLNAESRYLIVEADEREAPSQAPPGYCWITRDQLNVLVRHGHYLNVQARTLLVCLNSLEAAA
ncbi:NDP-hexose 2,3-dehydratase family protein [Streptomyces sp. NPDC059639]|uniref:NDP-hexose 2,3-dehydratase family protein n=1 Tax=Streptomyces sp. NPDC059639 TaxID=3346891 RepID=UPI0036D01E24